MHQELPCRELQDAEVVNEEVLLFFQDICKCFLSFKVTLKLVPSYKFSQ